MQPVGLDVVKREKLAENFPFLGKNRICTVYIVRSFSGNMNHHVVLNFERIPIPIVTQVDFLFLPTTNLFVAFPTNFLADQNIVSCARAGLTFHFRDETLTGLHLRYMNLNGIINIGKE